MSNQFPEIIKENGFDFRWDIKRVWALDIPVEEIDVAELDWIFDLPFWSDGQASYNLTAREVIANPEKYPDHHNRLQECDTSYPIDIMKNLKGKWLILDGLHRLVKLVTDGNTKVKVRKLSRDLISQISPL
jgi:hypothetical protein